MTKSSATRRETDSFGAIDVPAERLWGAQTQRSLENFRSATSACRAPSSTRSAWSNKRRR